MASGKRRRKGDTLDNNASIGTSTTNSNNSNGSSGGIQAYSQCSDSVKSRRRALLFQTLLDLAGVSESSSSSSASAATKECSHLLRDTLLLLRSEDAAAARRVYDAITEEHSSRTLGQVMANISAMHEQLPSDRRSGVLALVARVFTGPELKAQWGMRFGNHQLQTARRLATEGSFPVDPHARSMPPSKKPKGAEPREAVEQFLMSSAEADVDGRLVLLRPLRELHREFLCVAPVCAKNMCYSTFRVLSLAKFSLASHPSRSVAGSAPGNLERTASMPLPGSAQTQEQRRRQQQPAFRPIRPMPPMPPGESVTEPFPQALGVMAASDISTLFSQDGATSGLLLSTGSAGVQQQMGSGLDFSALGAGPMPSRSLPLPLPLPPLTLTLPSLGLLAQNGGIMQPHHHNHNHNHSQHQQHHASSSSRGSGRADSVHVGYGGALSMGSYSMFGTADDAVAAAVAMVSGGGANSQMHSQSMMMTDVNAAAANCAIPNIHTLFNMHHPVSVSAAVAVAVATAAATTTVVTACGSSDASRALVVASRQQERGFPTDDVPVMTSAEQQQQQDDEANALSS
ncbi:hypothetical protein GGF37_002354, partial [Kickxella alabastrina]